MATLDEDESGKVDMEEFKKCWPIVKENLGTNQERFLE